MTNLISMKPEDYDSITNWPLVNINTRINDVLVHELDIFEDVLGRSKSEYKIFQEGSRSKIKKIEENEFHMIDIAYNLATTKRSIFYKNKSENHSVANSTKLTLTSDSTLLPVFQKKKKLSEVKVVMKLFWINY